MGADQIMLILIGRNTKAEEKVFDAIDTFLDVYRQGIKKDINDLTATEYYDIADSIHKNTVAYWEAILADPDADPDLRAIAPANVVSVRKLVEDLDAYYVSKNDDDRLIAEANFEDYENYMRWLKDAKDTGAGLITFDSWKALSRPAPGENEETVKEDAIETGTVVNEIYRAYEGEEQVNELRAATVDLWNKVALFSDDPEVDRVATANAATTATNINILERYNNLGNDDDRVTAELFLDKYQTYSVFYKWISDLNVDNLKTYDEWIDLGEPLVNNPEDLIVSTQDVVTLTIDTPFVASIEVFYVNWIDTATVSPNNIQITSPAGLVYDLDLLQGTLTSDGTGDDDPKYKSGRRFSRVAAVPLEYGRWTFKTTTIVDNLPQTLWDVKAGAGIDLRELIVVAP